MSSTYTRIIFFLALLIGVSGCGQTGYYLQAARGQISLLTKRTPVDTLLADPDVSAALRQRLTLADDIRRYAIDRLGLHGNKGYTSYVNLERQFVTWNVVAAAAYSLEPKTWCFPIAGCVAYKGFFKHDAALALEQALLAEGNDVLVYGVAAYSTLGWFDDPLMSTFIHYRDDDLAALIFHELAHQLVYVKDDSAFNEAFATAVETALLQRWLVERGDLETAARRKQDQERHHRVTEMVLGYRDLLQAAYSGPQPEKDKQRLFSEMKQAYRELQETGSGTQYYDWWFSRPLDNADLLTVSTYFYLVPAFLAMLEQHDGEIDRFVEAVRSLEKLDYQARQTELIGYTAP